jgi:hypothetical protein
VAETIATDLGFVNVKRGDWIICGDDGESYILNNESFQRTFTPVMEQQLSREPQGAQGRVPAETDTRNPNESRRPACLGVRKHGTHRASCRAPKRSRTR